MKKPGFLRFQRPVTFRGQKIELPDALSVVDRQTRIPGYNQIKLSQSKIVLIGAGGLGSQIGEGLVRKGIGEMAFYDPDFVENTNLNRQKFYLRDIGENKAICLARNLKVESTCGTVMKAFPYAIEKHIEGGKVPKASLYIIAVDSYKTRFEMSRFLLAQNKQGIFLGVSEDTNFGYVFIQEPGGPCFSCAFPRSPATERTPCPNTPAVMDILKVVAGYALFAIDSLLMGLARTWNMRFVCMNGSVDDIKANCQARPGCELCDKSGFLKMEEEYGRK